MTVNLSLPPTVAVVTDGVQGPPGMDGADGAPGADGQAGAAGAAGASAYAIWLSLGNTGTQQNFIDSLKGPKGDPGAGGGVTPVFYDDPVAAGIITLNTVADWTPVIGTGGKHVGRTIPANTGDIIQWSSSFLRTGTTFFLDAVIRATNGTISRFVSSGTPTPNSEGYAAWYAQSQSFPGVSGTRTFTVQPGEIDASGNWTLEMVYKGGDSSCRVYFGDGYDGYWNITHWPTGG